MTMVTMEGARAMSLPPTLTTSTSCGRRWSRMILSCGCRLPHVGITQHKSPPTLPATVVASTAVFTTSGRDALRSAIAFMWYLRRSGERGGSAPAHDDV